MPSDGEGRPWPKAMASKRTSTVVDASSAAKAKRTQHLWHAAPGWRLPRHLGIILDGNRRYAREVAQSAPLEGHLRGSEKLKEVLQWCLELGVSILTVWVFSLDNFKRPPAEVEGLMALLEQNFRQISEDEQVHRHGVRVRALGRREVLPRGVQEAMRQAERATAHHERFCLNVAVAYDGRAELVDAFRAYLDERKGDAAAGDAAAAKALTAADIERHLYTAGQPPPDLIIRTSGELRLSGFLLWQSVYAELFFCEAHWPAFEKLDLLEALQAYHGRQRRFGG